MVYKMAELCKRNRRNIQLTCLRRNGGKRTRKKTRMFMLVYNCTSSAGKRKVHARLQTRLTPGNRETRLVPNSRNKIDDTEFGI